MHSWRTGISLDGLIYRSDEMTDYLGTYTFGSLADYEAGRPRSYTRRIGDPLVGQRLSREKRRRTVALDRSGGDGAEDDTDIDDVATVEPGRDGGGCDGKVERSTAPKLPVRAAPSVGRRETNRRQDLVGPTGQVMHPVVGEQLANRYQPLTR